MGYIKLNSWIWGGETSFPAQQSGLDTSREIGKRSVCLICFVAKPIKKFVAPVLGGWSGGLSTERGMRSKEP